MTTATLTPSSDLFSPDAYQVKLEAFEGPLDLLLHLIRKNEVDIANIPIAEITRQYLAYLELMKELNLDVAGDFLVMASTLLQIKSRLLLPLPAGEETEEGEEEDPRAELVRRLLEYQRYKEAGLTLGNRDLVGRDTFTRAPDPPELAELPAPEETLEVDLFELIEAFRRILAKVPVERFHEVGTEHISIADRINDLVDYLRDRPSATFEELFAGSATREFVVATFLAVLEMCRLRMIRLFQADSRGTIWITPTLGEARGHLDGEGGE